MFRIIYNHKVLSYRKSKPDARNYKKGVKMKCYHRKHLKIKKEKIIPSDRKKKGKKVKCCDSNKDSPCHKKAHIIIFRGIFMKSILYVLDFWHIFI